MKATPFQSDLGEINQKILDLLNNHIDKTKLNQNHYFERLNEFESTLQQWVNALDDFALVADDYYSASANAADPF